MEKGFGKIIGVAAVVAIVASVASFFIMSEVYLGPSPQQAYGEELVISSPNGYLIRQLDFTSTLQKGETDNELCTIIKIPKNLVTTSFGRDTSNKFRLHGINVAGDIFSQDIDLEPASTIREEFILQGNFYVGSSCGSTSSNAFYGDLIVLNNANRVLAFGATQSYCQGESPGQFCFTETGDWTG